MPSSSLFNAAADQDGDPQPDHDAMGRLAAARDKPSIDIVLDTPFLTLKGTGPDVEPTRLSGNVILHLTEATSIKEITLQFRGKARLPVPANDSLINNSTSLAYIICHHDWSFLEGSNRHARTLKAGRHLFPFHLEVGGSLPSSLSTHVLGGASIAYKLRAVAVRPFLTHNLQSVIKVPLLRSFTSESLEYQQTLEIENTWPGKIMYSVVLPQKAWAMGDKLGTLVKLSPMTKGVVVESILTNLLEITKIYARTGKQEHTRVVASSRHDFIEGRPVLIESNKPWLVIGQASPMVSRRGTPPTTASSTPASSAPPTQPPSAGPSMTNLASQHFSPPPSFSATRPQEGHAPHPPALTDSEDAPLVSSDIVTVLFLPIPDDENDIVPSHTLEPIMVTHRVRWSIYIRNPDSHVSELRCSLPVTILNKELIQEVRAYTRSSRRTVLGPGLENAPLDEGDDLLVGADEENAIEDRELPSYTAHVRDRVANMFLPEAATMRITNPWVINGTSPVSPSNASAFMESAQGQFALNEDRPAPPLVNTHDALSIFAHAYNPELTGSVSSASLSSLPAASVTSLPVATVGGAHTPPLYGLSTNASTSAMPTRHGRSTSHNSSGYTTPLEVATHIMAHLPRVPGSGESTPLDWINCELMMSVSEDPRSRFQSPPVAETTQSRSRGPSRGPSRASSPERSTSRPSSPVHENGHHQKGLGGFFKGAIKGLSFTKHHGHSPHHLPWNSSSSQNQGSSHPVHDTRPAPLPTRPTPSRQASLVAVSPDPAIAHTYIPPQPPSRPTSRPGSPFTPPPHPRMSGSFSVSSGIPRTHSASAFPISPSIPTTNDEMLHRAFTEVPDYSIASRGFIGGVPPLSSLQGLPSYEESARMGTGDRYRHPPVPPRTATPDPVSASRTGGIGGVRAGLSQFPVASGLSLGEDRRVMSDGDLARRLQDSGMTNGTLPNARDVVGGENGVTGSGDTSEGEDDGIQMRSRRRTVTARREEGV